MGLFNFFKHKKKSTSLTTEEQQLLDKMAVLFFGSADERNRQTIELHDMLGHRYGGGQVAGALVWMTMRLQKDGDKSSYALVDEGQMKRPNNPFTHQDAITIYRFVVRKQFERIFPKGDDSAFDYFYKSLGNATDGATTDVIPGAYGEYGYDVTNPIPTRGVPANEVYLNKLALLSGEKFHWNRIGSFGAPNIKNPIDGYEIITDSGKSLCTLYISPYQSTISNMAPKGFYIKW